MELNFESIVFYILLIDAVGANILAYSSGQAWWQRNLTGIARLFPLSRGWTTYYLVLVLIMGALLYRQGALLLPW